MTLQQTTAQVVFTALDRTAAGVASVKTSLGATEMAAKKATAGMSLIGGAATAALAGIAAAGAGLKAFNSETERLDRIAKSAAKSGFGAQEYQRLDHMATLSGTSVDALAKASLKLQLNLRDIADGGGKKAAAALQDLGLSAEHLEGLSTPERLAVMADRLNGVNDRSTRAAIAFELFGKSGTELLPMLAAGSDGIREMNNELERTFTAAELARAEKYQDELTRLKHAGNDLKTELTISLAPAITKTAKFMTQSAKGWSTAFRDPAEGVENFHRGLHKLMPTLIAFEEKAENISGLGLFTVGQEKFQGLLETVKARAQAEEENVALLEQQAIYAEHNVNLLEAQGAEGEALEDAYSRQYDAKIALLRATGDQLGLEQALRAEAVRQAAVQAGKKRRRGGGRATTEAERLKQEGEIQLKIWEDRLTLMEREATLAGRSEEMAYEAARIRRDLAMEELSLERQVLESTRAKSSLERERNAARIEAIGREQEILAKEQEIALQEESNRLVAEAVQLSNARTQAEANAVRRAYEVSSLRRDSEAEAIELEAEHALATERNAYRRIDLERDKNLQILALQRKRLAEEKKAEEAALDAREAALRSESGGSPLEQAQREEELKQVHHEREMLRLQQQAEARRLLEQEKAAHFQAEQARNEATWAMVNEGLENFQAFQAQIADTANFFTEYRNAAADADHAQTIRVMEERGAAQKAALDREIAAAKGNVELQNKLRQKQARQDAQLRRQIEVAEAKHQDKRKRQEARAAGIQLMIVAAVETVKAVAAFAGFNYVEGALRVAAAALAATKGGMLLSGHIPGGGAEANLPSAGGAGGGLSAGADRDTVDPSNVPGSVPGQAARRESATPRDRPQDSRPTVVIQGDVNAWGEITPTIAEDLGRAIGDVSRSREL